MLYSRPKAGFSAIELVVVIVVVGILSVAAVSTFHIADDRESLAAERLGAAIRYSQSWAMMSHNKTWVSFDTLNNRYTLYVEDPANPGQAGRLLMTDPVTLGNFQITLGSDETGGVSLASPNFGGQTQVEFDHNGLAYDGNDVALTSNGTVKVGARTVTISPAGWVGVS